MRIEVTNLTKRYGDRAGVDRRQPERRGRRNRGADRAERRRQIHSFALS